MTREEKIERLKKACEVERYFPGVLGNPVTFAARWGLPLSKSYLAYLDKRRRKSGIGKPARARRRKTAKR